MPSDRELRTVQQDKLYTIYLLEEKWKNDTLQEDIFVFLGEQAKSGMTADEIDAVKERVKVTIESDKKTKR